MTRATIKSYAFPLLSLALLFWASVEFQQKRKLQDEKATLLEQMSYLSPLDSALQAFWQGDTATAATLFGIASEAAWSHPQLLEGFYQFTTRLEADRQQRDSLQQLSQQLQKSSRKLQQISLQLQANLMNKALESDSLTEDLNELRRQQLQLEKEQDQLQAALRKAQNAYAKLEFKNAEGLAVRYFGKVEQGRAAGFGIGLFESKGIYEGEWLNNARHGRGRYTWANGDQYEGEFKNGMRDGKGTYTFSTGESYVGDWKNDLRDGKGRLLDAGKSVLLDGDWEKDRFIRKPNKNATDSTQQQSAP